MTDSDLYRLAYNAHELAEAAALDAMRSHLESVSLDALACLSDPQWRWETRSWMSDAIIDAADDLLTKRLDALVAA